MIYSSQLQPWMNSLPGIRIVFHSQFMPKEVLPTYNSRAIEMYLHRIDGLSERFLYGNDDMFPLAPMQEDDFFRDGLPCLHWKMKSYNPSKAFHMACLNGLNFVAAEFGKHYESEWIHIGHNVVPMIKSTCEMFWERWPKKMQESVTTFRLPRNYNQYIYSWWQILSDQYVDYKPPRGYISTGKDINGVQLSFMQFVVAAVISWVCMFIFEQPKIPDIITAAPALAYSGIMSCGIAYTLQIVGQKHASPVVASLLMCLESVFAVITAAIVLQEMMSFRELAGCVTMFAAIVIAQLPSRTSPEAR